MDHLLKNEASGDQTVRDARSGSPVPRLPKRWIIVAAGAGLVAIAAVVLGLMIGAVSVDGGSVTNNASQFSLVILLVQACVSAFGLLARFVANQSLWSQLGAAAENEGVPLSSLDRSSGPLAMLATWSSNTTGSIGAVLRFALTLIFTTWLGTAIVPRIGQVHWYDAPSPVTTMNDVATSLQTGNCYTPADPSGLNLGSCTGSWKVGTVASLTLSSMYVSGNTYNSGCATGYTGCAQAAVAGISPMQTIHNFYPFSSTSAVLPTYQVNLQCNLNQGEIYGAIQTAQNESIWVTYANSTFVLNMLGLDALGIQRSVVGQCSVSLASGQVEWEQDASNVAVAKDGVLPDQADPSILVQQFADLVTWANTTRIGYSWAPLLGVLMSGHDDGDLAPLAQILNGLLAGLLNRAYTDSVLHTTATSTVSVSRPRIHFATGVARWLCVAGGVLVALSAVVLVTLVYRSQVRMVVNRWSNFLLAQTIRLDGAQRTPLNGIGKTDTLVAKWREDSDDDSYACIIIDEKGKGDDLPRLRGGISYAARSGR